VLYSAGIHPKEIEEAFTNADTSAHSIEELLRIGAKLREYIVSTTEHPEAWDGRRQRQPFHVFHGPAHLKFASDNLDFLPLL
jgi:hypothetical protein